MNAALVIFTGLTALATTIAAAVALYPFIQNRRLPRIAYAFNVDLRAVLIPSSPFGIRLTEPEKRRFVLVIENPRLIPLTVNKIFFHAKHPTTDHERWIVQLAHAQIPPRSRGQILLKMDEPNIPRDRSEVLLVIEGVE